jgi:two-component system, NtrC family, sensor kinase
MEFKPMKFLMLLLVVFCATRTDLSAQTATADSLRKEIAALDKTDPHYLDQKAGAIGTLLQHLKYSHPAQSLLLCDTLYDVFMQVKDTVKAYEAKYRYKAGIYEIRGASDSMLIMLESYAEALAAINQSDGYVYVDIGNVYFGFSMFGLAAENYNRAEQLFVEAGNLQGLCTIYNNRAQMNMAGELKADSALMWLRKSYHVRANQLKDPVLSHESMYLMSVVFRRNEQYDSAKLYLWQVISDIESGRVDKHTDHIALRQEFSGAFTAMGIIYSAQGNQDSAEYYFSTGEKLYTESGYNNRLPGLYNAWSRFYIRQGDATRSWEYLKKSEAYTSDENPSALITLYQLYADWYEWQGKTEEMYKYRLKYYILNDSLQSSSNTEQMMIVASRVLQLEDKAHIEQQRAEIARQDLEAEQAARGRLRLIIVAAALLIIVAIAIFGVVQLRKKNALIEQYNRELESANATKEQFLSVISHDLRGPFNALIGMSDLVRENAKNNNFTNIEQNTERISEASRKAFILLDNLMQWVSIQKENIVVKKEWVSADEVIVEILTMMREHSLSRNMIIEKNVVVAKINTDKTLLQVVLRNLISNAVKYTPAGGKILVSCLIRNDKLELIVDDNGSGFPQSELDGLMNKQQGVSTAKKAGGLGLVLVRQFVQLLGGTIKAGNRKEGGARVTVMLPAVASGVVTVHDLPEVKTNEGLTAEEKLKLSAILARLSQYEFFDVTEIRELIEKPIDNETENIATWRKNLLQSVYLAEENKYAELIKAASV